MIWFYERIDEELRVETRFDGGSKEYVLVCHPQDGIQQVERFRNQEDFRARLRSLSAFLESTSWRRKGSPIFMRDGWKF